MTKASDGQVAMVRVLERELAVERARRQRIEAQIGGLRSSNSRLKVALALARQQARKPKEPRSSLEQPVAE